MTTDIRDCPPGTVPSWVLKFAYDGEEWLVLGDMTIADPAHTCTGTPSPTRFEISKTDGWGTCGYRRCEAPTTSDTYETLWYADCSLAEAEAAFTRLEQEWRAAKAGVL